MAGRSAPNLNITSGRRGYFRYLYGSHYWIPDVLADFSRGMVRDTPRVAIPPGSVYDSADYLLHRTGIAQKRGGTAYYGTALTSATCPISLVDVPGVGLVVVGLNGHLFKIAAGVVTDAGALSSATYQPLGLSPGQLYAIIPEAGTNAQKYDGTTISTLAGGMTLTHVAQYKSRIAGVSNAQRNRLLFSTAVDFNATWDTANSWFDFDNQISGLAPLNNVLMVFSAGACERLIGATPPPNTDMDRAPLFPVGCTDCRSIEYAGGVVFFANPSGIFMSNGGQPNDLTAEGGITTYWRDLMTGYVSAAPIPGASTWTIATGFWRGFLFVSVLDANRVVQATLMCNVARRAWWRLTNIAAMAWATSVDGNELYYADGSTNRVVAMSGIFNPTSANKNDANGNPVTPTIEFAPVGQGTGIKSYGFAHLDFDMRDAASDNPTQAVTIKTGIEADTSATPAESPLVETSTMLRPRISVCKTAQSVTIALAQTNASAKTELYSLEVETRAQPMTGQGVT